MSDKTYINSEGSKKEIDLQYILLKYHLNNVQELDDFIAEMLLKSTQLSKIKTILFKTFINEQ